MASTSEKSQQSLFWQFLAELAPFRSRLALALVLSLVGSGLAVTQPLLVSRLVDEFKGSINTELVLLLGLVLLGAAAANVLQEYLLERTGERLVYKIRTSLIGRLLRLDMKVLDNSRRGELLSIAGNDTSALRGVLSQGIVDFISQSLTLVVAIVMMFVLDWRLSLFVLIAVLVLCLVAVLLSIRTRPATDRLQAAVGEMTGSLDRSLRGIRTVRSFLAVDSEEATAVRKARAARDMGLRVALLKAIVGAFTTTSVQVMLLVVIGVGAFRVSSGALTVGNLSAFIMYVMLVITPAAMLGGLSASFNEALGAYARIKRTMALAVEPEAKSPGEYGETPGQAGVDISFEAVSFGYSDSDTDVSLDNVTFEIASGETVAIVGPSGAGKSTIFSLLERFYSPQSGTIEFLGRDIKDQSIARVRSNLVLVDQDPTVFSGTVRDNLLLANPQSSDEDCLEVLDAVRLGEVLCDAPGRLSRALDLDIGDDGVKLSGGEKQRLAIARALLSPARVVLLDEATSSLDSMNEKVVQEAIEDYFGGRTVLVIAHRLSTVYGADKIIVLDGGKVVAQGTHKDLLSECALYQELVEGQLIA